MANNLIKHTIHVKRKNVRSRKKILELNKPITYRDRVRSRVDPDKAVHQCIITFVEIIKILMRIDRLNFLKEFNNSLPIYDKSKHYVDVSGRELITDPRRLLT